MSTGWDNIPALLRGSQDLLTIQHWASAVLSSWTEDIFDLITLYSDIPQDPEALKNACDALREEIGHHRKRRKQIFDELVTFQAEVGTSGKMANYRTRRLIGAGSIPPSEVDQVLVMLLENLESEEPSSPTTAWGPSKRPG
ncbi:hypothetical protein BT96DRAFT_1016288 [Gymnopus androsaceus JB14]|uniref:Uncharacterized protein n=1 Tax=Gymnopus androsaceus JB14 TaxID=1447944 RepID=A0A6A4I4V9_9AGAR|nr:hypothetical protein BT96DRAFT_1016288 [Gymnopus androsaceus JB14]